MKVEELMVGDLLRVNKEGVCIPKGTIVTVRAIDSTNKLEPKGLIGAASCESVEDRSINGGVWVDFLEPIPLTSEILEKNGFKKEGSWFVIEDDYYDVSIGEITDSIWRVEYCNMEFSVFDCILHIASVHELQHALKFCGVDKEIVI